MDSLFGDAARRLLAETFSPEVLDAAERGEPPGQAWQAVEESGFLDALVSEPSGGAGLRLSDILPLALESGACGIGVPLVQTLLARAWLDAAGHAPPAGPIALAAFGVKVDQQQTAARAVPGALTAQWVLADTGADILLLSAQAAVRTRTEGHGNLDADLRWPAGAGIAFSCPRQEANSSPDQSSLAAMLAATCSALMAGAMERVLMLTTEYAGQRIQFGKPIGRFQAIQQQLSVMAEYVWDARMAAQLAFQSDGALPQPLLAALGKARTSAAAPIVADIAHAVHGAIGITREYTLQRYTRRLREWRRAAGAEAYWAGLIGADALAADCSALDYIRQSLFAVIE